MARMTQDPLVQVGARSMFNIRRVRNLLTIFQELSPGQSRNVDLLRAAVVMLHATLEDALRGLLRWKLPRAAAEHLRGVSFDRERRTSKISVEELAAHRGKTIQRFLCEIVNAHVERQSFNNTTDIANALQVLGLSVQETQFDSLAPSIGAMIERRHKIAHESDRPHPKSREYGRPVPLAVSDVVAWVDNVERFSRNVLDCLIRKKPE
jgi:hypothetical protein